MSWLHSFFYPTQTIQILEAQQYYFFFLVSLSLKRGYCICESFLIIPVWVFVIHLNDFAVEK